jgi:hypothetical protein
MSKELETIAQVTSVGDLPEKLQEAEETKGEVENQLTERVSKSGSSDGWLKYFRKWNIVAVGPSWFMNRNYTALRKVI